MVIKLVREHFKLTFFMARKCSKLPVPKEDRSPNGTSWEAWGSMRLIPRGRRVLGGPFRGAGGLQIVGMGRKGQRKEGRCGLGCEAVTQDPVT